jgi:hypothetical protein
MPSDVKAALSAVTLVVALVLAYWRGSPIRHDFSTFVVGTAVFMIVAMWVFPEASTKKRGAGRSKVGASAGRPREVPGNLAKN